MSNPTIHAIGKAAIKYHEARDTWGALDIDTDATNEEVDAAFHAMHDAEEAMHNLIHDWERVQMVKEAQR